jgi:hypothetical protein
MTQYAGRARWLGTIFVPAGVSVCALALVACTSGDGPRPSESPSPSAFHPPTPPLTTIEQGALSGVVPVPWDTATLVDDRTVDVRYLGAPNRCRVLANVRVKESPTDITITVYLGTPPDHAVEMCTNLGIPARTRVPLSSPLGARRVLDGGTKPPEERTVTKP